MQLTLTDDEARTLRHLLEGVLPELKMEAARTDLASRELLHELMRRRELAQRLLAELSAAPAR